MLFSYKQMRFTIMWWCFLIIIYGNILIIHYYIILLMYNFINIVGSSLYSLSQTLKIINYMAYSD